MEVRDCPSCGTTMDASTQLCPTCGSSEGNLWLTCDLCAGDFLELEMFVTTDEEVICAECAQRGDVQLED